MLRFSAVSAALFLLPSLAGAQTLVGREDSVYIWRGAIGAGRLLRVSNVNGPVDVRAAEGQTAELRAEKRARGGELTDVAFDVQTSASGDVTICSTYRRHDSCHADDRSWHDDDGEWGHQMTVAMTVLVPRGVRVTVSTGNGAVTMERVGGTVHGSTGNGRVRVIGTGGDVSASTGNGDVEVRDATGQVRVSTGNGRVSVTTSEGPVNASSGNGDIDVRMTSLRASSDMGFSTGSGSVRLTLPANYNGELDATTGNGAIHSDFDLKVKGRFSAHRIRATIGDGGQLLRMTTGNGQLELKKGQ